MLDHRLPVRFNPRLMKIGILGYSQSGKKTLFTLLTGRQVPAVRKEGEVIEGIAPIRDPRVDELTRLVKPERSRYAENSVALLPDVACGGGERPWLEAARRSDLLCIVVRSFPTPSVYHPAGSVDHERDRANLDAELLVADLEMVEKRLERLAKEKRGGQTTQQAAEEQTLTKCRTVLESGKPLKSSPMEEHEEKAIRSLGLVTMLPILWTYNVGEEQLGETAWKDRQDVFVVSCLIEQEIAGLQDEGERQEYLKSLGLSRSGLDRLNAAAYDTLGLMSFYTIGKDEVRAWTIRKGTRAPEAAGKIHSDIERGFIRADVIKYDELVAAGGEDAIRKAGKEQLKGKDYVIQDGDICHFRFNV